MKLVLTICTPRYRGLGAITIPRMQDYADRCGAEFRCLDDVGAHRSPHFLKFEVFTLLAEFERVLYLDVDTLVARDCRDLFELPRATLHALDEAPFTENRQKYKARAARTLQLPKPRREFYINTGVMLVSQSQIDAFAPMNEALPSDKFYEQSFINARLDVMNIPVRNLDRRFNYMSCFPWDERRSADIIHYAGLTRTPNIGDAIMQDSNAWNEVGR